MNWRGIGTHGRGNYAPLYSIQTRHRGVNAAINLSKNGQTAAFSGVFSSAWAQAGTFSLKYL